MTLFKKNILSLSLTLFVSAFSDAALPNSSVVQLHSDSGECSGVVANGGVILTAAHCDGMHTVVFWDGQKCPVYDQKDSGINDASQIRVVPSACDLSRYSRTSVIPRSQLNLTPGMSVEAWGYPNVGGGNLYRSSCRILSVVGSDVITDCFIDISLDGRSGISGGPLVIGNTLIGVCSRGNSGTTTYAITVL